MTESNLLFDERPIVINRKLAKIIGLNEAIVLQQMHYWIKTNKENGRNFYDGKYWTFKSIKRWQEEDFEFLSLNTVKRTFKKLEDKNLLIVGNYNKRAYDRTKWYTINYELLESLKPCNYSLAQNEPMEKPKMGQPIQEINKENNKETNTIQEVCVLSPLEKKIKSLLKDKFTDTYTEEYATRVLRLVKAKNETLEGFKEKLEMALDRNIQNKNGYLLKAIQDNYKKPLKNTSSRKIGFSNFNETVKSYSETDLNALIAASQGSKFGEF